MMNLILSGLVGVLLASTVVYRTKYKATKEALNKAMLLANKTIENAETLKDTAETAMQGYKLMEYKYETLKAEHDVIFNNLVKDPMCLAKAMNATDELYELICESGKANDDMDCDTMLKFLEISFRCDSLGDNYYRPDNDEIKVSLFDDYENEQGKFMYDYLNDKYGISLDGSDIRTNTIFTTLHELGHYVDYSNKKKAGEFELYNKQDVERRLALDEIENARDAWKAYREIPAEAFADKWAVEFIIKYFPELV